MPSEVSIAKALSGPEALEACLITLRESLNRDSRFAPHMAYSGFHCEIRFQFTPVMGFIPPIDQKVMVDEGESPSVDDLPTVDEHLILPVRPPNEVRVAAGLDVPVLVTDGKGQTTEKWVGSGRVPKQGGVIPKGKGSK
jgi:hypothetical protein